MHNLKNDLVGKIYGDYNALAINMGVGCDCDPDTKGIIILDYLDNLGRLNTEDANSTEENDYERAAEMMKKLSEISKSENKIIYVPIRKPKNSDNTI